MKLFADLFHTKRLFIASFCSCVDLKQKPAALEAFPLGTKPSAASPGGVDGWCRGGTGHVSQEAERLTAG